MRSSLLFIWLFLMFGSGFLATSCYQKPEFPNAPFISNPVLTSTVVRDCTLVNTDVVRINMNFQDGDGNLGLDATDINPPFNAPTTGQTNFYYTNFKLKVFRKVGNTFEPFILPDTSFNYNQRFPRLDEKDRVSPIQGTLSNRVSFSQIGIAPNTILKFRIQILDRSLNLSNELETDTISINRR